MPERTGIRQSTSPLRERPPLAVPLLTVVKTVPYPVDKPTYSLSIEILRKTISWAKLGLSEKKEAINRVEKMREG